MLFLITITTQWIRMRMTVRGRTYNNTISEYMGRCTGEIILYRSGSKTTILHRVWYTDQRELQSITFNSITVVNASNTYFTLYDRLILNRQGFRWSQVLGDIDICYYCLQISHVHLEANEIQAGCTLHYTFSAVSTVACTEAMRKIRRTYVETTNPLTVLVSSK